MNTVVWISPKEETPRTVKENHSFLRRHRACISALLFTVASAVVVFCNEDAKITVADVVVKPLKAGIQRGIQGCPQLCSIRHHEQNEKWGGDLLSVDTLIKRAEEERVKVMDKLNEDYGKENVEKIFLDVKDFGFESADLQRENGTKSRDRFVRKFMRKILTVQQAVQDDNKNINGCDCLSNSSSTSTARLASRRLQGRSTNIVSDLPPLPEYYAKLVWSTGGHSASAGHGNYHDESYTKVMEATVKDVFAAVGIDFQGRNYAMGTMDSAPQLALCNEAVYGFEIDILSWDFGMIDGNAYWKTYMYGSRAGMHHNRPLFVSLSLSGNRNDQKSSILKDLEKKNVPSMVLRRDAWGGLKDLIPDMEGLTQDQIDAIPKNLRYMKCGNDLEKGDPGCSSNKYSPSTPECKLFGQVGWHPGWKIHALHGKLMALFVIEILMDSLKEVNSILQNATSIESALRHLEKEEDDLYDYFYNSTIPGSLTESQQFDDLKEDFADQADEVKQLLYRGQSYCHTAILPSETRFRGYLTEHEGSTFDNFDYGMTHDDALARNDTGTFQLVSTHGYQPHGQSPNCTHTVNADFKDSFIVRHEDGDAHMTLPNDKENEVYLGGKGLMNVQQAVIIVCLPICEYQKCPPGNILWKDIDNGNVDVTMEVNGQKVTKTKFLSQKRQDVNQRDGCNILVNEDGYFWKSNDKGQFDFMTRVSTEERSFRFSSFIVNYKRNEQATKVL